MKINSSIEIDEAAFFSLISYLNSDTTVEEGASINVKTKYLQGLIRLIPSNQPDLVLSLNPFPVLALPIILKYKFKSLCKMRGRGGGAIKCFNGRCLRCHGKNCRFSGVIPLHHINQAFHKKLLSYNL